MLSRILALHPIIEVAVKALYWRVPAVHQLLSLKNITPRRNVAPQALEPLLTQLRNYGIAPGDILIVHASMGNLKALELSPDAIIAALRVLIGERGTLAMPAIPYFAEEPTGPARLSDAICNVPVAYDVQHTPPWTGALAKALMATPGAIRSRHPLNSMVAIGPEAAAMMAHNLDGDRPLACGVGSSWHYCAQRNAKILALGVDLAHSLTMIHEAEDIGPWPIAHWYRERLFDITDTGNTQRVRVRERHPRWSIHFAERTLARDLRIAGILSEADTGTIHTEFIESHALLYYLRSRNFSGYPYYFTRFA